MTPGRTRRFLKCPQGRQLSRLKTLVSRRYHLESRSLRRGPLLSIFMESLRDNIVQTCGVQELREGVAGKSLSIAFRRISLGGSAVLKWARTTVRFTILSMDWLLSSPYNQMRRYRRPKLFWNKNQCQNWERMSRRERDLKLRRLLSREMAAVNPEAKICLFKSGK